MKRFLAPVLVLLALCLLRSPVAAQEEPTIRPLQATTPLGRLDESMLGFRHNLQSARAKFRSGVVDGSGESDGHAATPMWACCKGNLTRMQKRSAEMKSLVAELGKCYREESNDTGTTALGSFRMDHAQLDTGVQKMVDADTREAAESVIELMVQAYLQLQRSRDALPPCPAEAGAPPREGGENGEEGESEGQ